jgi:proteasome accessory factor C
MSTASTGAREQVGRLLALVPYLHARGEVRLDEAARGLGVPERQLVKDLKVLFMCGLPGGYPDDLIDVDVDALDSPSGDRVIRVQNADYLARPLRLSPTEATAVIVGLRALRESTSDDATREIVDRALAKLEQAAAEGAAAVDPGEDVADSALTELRGRLAGAVARGRQVRIAYFVPSRDEESERVVDPRALVEHHGALYLDAWCHSAEAPRLFRLDRIRTADVLDAPVGDHGGADAMADSLFTRSERLASATLRLAPGAHWAAEYYPVSSVTPLADGRLEVTLPVADERWVERLVLRLTPDVEVVSPAALAANAAATARSALRLYDGHA